MRSSVRSTVSRTILRTSGDSRSRRGRYSGYGIDQASSFILNMPFGMLTVDQFDRISVPFGMLTGGQLHRFNRPFMSRVDSSRYAVRARWSRGIVVRDGLGQRWNSVLPRDDACLESEGLGRGARHGADAGHGHAAEQPRQVLARKERREVTDGGRAGEGDNVNPGLAERPAELCRVLGSFRPRPVGRHFVDQDARGLQQRHEHIASLGGPGEKDALAGPGAGSPPPGERLGEDRKSTRLNSSHGYIS